MENFAVPSDFPSASLTLLCEHIESRSAHGPFRDMGFYESALRDSCDAINEAAISDSVLINKDPPEKKTEEGTRAQKKPRHIKNWDERLLKTRSPL